MEPSASTFLFKMFSYMFETWEYMSKCQYNPSRKNIFIGVISRALYKSVSRASEIKVEEADAELQAFLEDLKKFEASLNERTSYLQEYKREFLNPLSNKCRTFEAKEEVTVLCILCKELKTLLHGEQSNSPKD